MMHTVRTSRLVGRKSFLQSTFFRRDINTAKPSAAPAISVPLEGGISMESPEQSGSHLAGGRVKPFSAMPGPKGLPYIGVALELGKGIDDLPAVYGRWKEGHGRLIKYKVFGKEDVHVFDPELIHQVYDAQGKTPKRNYLDIWRLYRETRQQSLGPVLADGEEWLRMRAALNPAMFRIPKIKSYVPDVARNANALSQHLQRAAAEYAKERGIAPAESSDGSTVSTGPRGYSSSSPYLVRDVKHALGLYAMDNIVKLVTGKNAGTLGDTPSDDFAGFVDTVDTALAETGLAFFGVPIYRWFPSLDKNYQRMAAAFDSLYAFFCKHVERRIEEIQRNPDQPCNDMIATVLATGKMTKDEAIINCTDILLGGIDTTRTTLTWALLNLAQNPTVQETLYQEVHEVLHSGSEADEDYGKLTAEKLDKMKYMKACLKESLRLTPTVMMGSRILHNDIELGGYQIPAGTHFALDITVVSRDPEIFREPERFIPERYLAGSEWKDHHPYASLPFGHGARKCVGHLVAKLNLQVALTTLVKNFEISHSGEKIKYVSRMLQNPEKPVDLVFTPRK